MVVRETDTFDLYSYEDTDGDGKADKELVFKGGRRGNLEHQPSGMRWNIDNWMYVTYSNRRYRMQTNGMIEAEQIAGTGQWGIAYDEMGPVDFLHRRRRTRGTSFPNHAAVRIAQSVRRDGARF